MTAVADTQVVATNLSTRATVHERFVDIARVMWNEPAVSGATGVLTYAELDERSARLAEALRAHVTPSDQLVAISMRRGLSVPVAILAVLRAGLAYVPIDPTYPSARQRFLLQDSGAGLVVDDGYSDVGDWDSITQVEGCRISRSQWTCGLEDVPRDTAYVIYTSGSSGTPKGCMVGHEHILSLIDAADEIFDFGSDDIWALFHSHSFDFSVWEMFGAFLHGGSVAVVTQEEAVDPSALVAMLHREQVTVLNQTPSAFAFLVREAIRTDASFPAVRHVVFGGEAARPDDIWTWLQNNITPAARVSNMYGITETTVHVTHCFLTLESLKDSAVDGGVPIGRPLPHLEVALHDDSGDSALPGGLGEIVISGSSVSYGYLGRTDETVRRFRDDGSGRIGYHSGDCGVMGSDGVLWFVGRKDNQVKVNGFRIELDEIEEVLRAGPNVSLAVCTVDENKFGQRMLVGYVVAKIPRPGNDAALRGYLEATLPAHMRPRRITWCDHLPLTVHGKVERSAQILAEADQ